VPNRASEPWPSDLTLIITFDVLDLVPPDLAPYATAWHDVSAVPSHVATLILVVPTDRRSDLGGVGAAWRMVAALAGRGVVVDTLHCVWVVGSDLRGDFILAAATPQAQARTAYLLTARGQQTLARLDSAEASQQVQTVMDPRCRPTVGDVPTEAFTRQLEALAGQPTYGFLSQAVGDPAVWRGWELVRRAVSEPLSPSVRPQNPATAPPPVQTRAARWRPVTSQAVPLRGLLALLLLVAPGLTCWIVSDRPALAFAAVIAALSLAVGNHAFRTRRRRSTGLHDGGAARDP